jgi:hypothetical protein
MRSIRRGEAPLKTDYSEQSPTSRQIANGFVSFGAGAWVRSARTLEFVRRALEFVRRGRSSSFGERSSSFGADLNQSVRIVKKRWGATLHDKYRRMGGGCPEIPLQAT